MDVLTFHPTELRPLTDAAVTTYGSHGNCEVYNGRGGEDYVIIVSDSDSPADACSSCEEVRKAEGHPATPPMSRGILKTSHRHPQVQYREREGWGRGVCVRERDRERVCVCVCV